MSSRRHPLLIVVLAGLLGAVWVGSAALDLGHALTHLDAPRVAAHAAAGGPDDAEDGDYCGLCLSLSQGRTALSPASAPELPFAVALERAAAPAPRCAPQCVALSPASPRAPPLG